MAAHTWDLRNLDGAMLGLGDRVERQNVWPEETDVGRPVILPGGEVGILRAWWNAEDGSSWRWRVEFSNQV